jgi:hypothetical protein
MDSISSFNGKSRKITQQDSFANSRLTMIVILLTINFVGDLARPIYQSSNMRLGMCRAWLLTAKTAMLEVGAVACCHGRGNRRTGRVYPALLRVSDRIAQ